jgi:putative SOS response-associated peptidase YedK
MCGRFTQVSDEASLAQRFQAVLVHAPRGPRYNIAPTDPVAVVVREGAARVLDELRWGLLPAWAKSLKDKPQPFNAKAETLARSRMFQRLLPSQRCLVVADSFFEWRKVADARVPMRVHLREKGPFAFAGLWDSWRDPANAGAKPVRSCTIVTVAANALVATIHDRMPAILRPEDEARWLDPALRDPADLARLLAPLAPEAMELYQVSAKVNDARNKGPECIEPAA